MRATNVINRHIININCRIITLTAGAVAALAYGQSFVRADVAWNEGVHGDLSNDRLNPTVITVGLGVNSILATSVSGDREYFTMTLAPGWKLEQIFLASYASVDLTAFIGVQNGTVFTEPPTGTNVANLLGWAHFGPGVNTVGTDILDNMGVGNGAIGFTPPLPAGSYTFWSQQTGTNAATYRFGSRVGAIRGDETPRRRNRCRSGRSARQHPT